MTGHMQGEDQHLCRERDRLVVSMSVITNAFFVVWVGEFVTAKDPA